MNVSMWAKAINVIPRVSKQEWDGLDVISRWLIATRSAVLVMTYISAAIAGLLAARAGRFDLLLWLMVTVGLLFAHATNNLTDHLKGGQGQLLPRPVRPATAGTEEGPPDRTRSSAGT